MTPSRPGQVLFCYEQFDELTLLHLREFDKKKLISVETDIVVDHYKEEKFEDGATVTVKDLLEAGVLSKCEYGVKVLGNGTITKKLTVEATAFSASAKEKIVAAGGKWVVV